MLRVFSLIALGACLGVLIFAYFSAGEIYKYEDTVDGVHLPKVDAIVCLAGGRGRIAASGDIWYRYWELAQTPLPGVGKNPEPQKTPLLYFSGMGHRTSWNTLVKQLRRGVLQVIKPVHVLIENESSNTEENAVWFLKQAKSHGWEKILLVTSSYHMKRAKHIFEKVLGTQIRVETLSLFQEPFEPGEWRTSLHGIHITIVEYMKWLYFKSLFFNKL